MNDIAPNPPPPSTIPTSLSSIQFHDPLVHDNIYTSLKSLRTSNLSLPNRLRSILHDSLFVQSIAFKYGLPLVANERCGSWYIPPEMKGGSAYFKSTDGHFGQWGFSGRRLNLQLLDVVEGKGGAVVVDSTRRGKWMPDALMKTVPIWCAVMNRVCGFDEGEWGKLQWPEGLIGKEEAERIEERLDGFVESFQKLGVKIQGCLSKPLKCFWVMQDREMLPSNLSNIPEDERSTYHAIILCSASKRVHGSEMSEGGYIQGAGDDAEAWAMGLTPEVFWGNQEVLLTAREEELEEVIEELTKKYQGEKGREMAVLVKPTTGLYLGTMDTMQDPSQVFDVVVNCHGLDRDEEERCKDVKRLDLNLVSDGKLGSRDLRKKLVQVKDFISKALIKNPEQKILVAGNTGKNLSVGVSLVLLCLFYDDEGRSLPADGGVRVDKTFVRQRLAWITQCKPSANPSRSTLQAVNSFLFERP